MNTTKTVLRQNNEVLIVDDSPLNIRLLTSILSTVGYKICTANSGELALQFVKTRLPVIILLDILMPGMDGFEVCHRLKSEQSTCNIPVIFISALEDESSILQGFQAGGVDYITRPFRREQVLARVNAHVKLQNTMLELNYQKNKLAEEIEEQKHIEEDLKKSEDRLRRAELESKSGNWEYHLNTNMIVGSEGAQKIYGLDKNQFEYNLIKNFSLTEYRPLLDAAMKDLIEKDKPYNIEFKIKSADQGIIKDIHNIATFDKERNVIFGLIQDITERKLVEEEVHSERKLLRTLIDNLPATVYVKDKEGRKIVANKRDVNFIGFENEADVLGKTDLELFEPSIGKLGYDEDLKVIQTGQALINMEEVFPDKNGINRWVITSKIPLYDQQGKPSGLVGIGRDITELKKAESQIKILTKSVEQSPSAIVITDIKGVIEYVNPKFTEVTGYTSKEAIGNNPRILKSGLMAVDVYKQLWSTLLAGEIWKGELINRKKNGELFWEWVTMASVKNDNGITTNYLAIKEDISQRKQMESDLIAAKEKAEESDRLKSAFLANMSHEIRTPLNSIIGFSELLADVFFDEEQKTEFIQHIIDNGNHLLSIISDIMDISKLESGEVKIYKKPIHARKFLSAIHKQFDIQFDGLERKLELSLPEMDEDVVISADPDRLNQIFNNLMNNAIKFTPHGSVQIGYQLLDHMVQFFVKDTGIGIATEFHDKIFERFRQVEISKARNYGGNGLGLAITKNLVELMGGRIWLESQSEKGSTFNFTLPVEIQTVESL